MAFCVPGAFPQCFGAIDGSHIPITTLRDNPLDYYNRKGTHSIILQALVDYKFMNIYVGWPGTGCRRMCIWQVEGKVEVHHEEE